MTRVKGHFLAATFLPSNDAKAALSLAGSNAGLIWPVRQSTSLQEISAGSVHAYATVFPSGDH